MPGFIGRSGILATLAQVIDMIIAPWLLLCLSAIAPCTAVKVFGDLARDVGAPPSESYNWDTHIPMDGITVSIENTHINRIFDIFKQYNLPAATLAMQLNPSPSAISYTAPAVPVAKPTGLVDGRL